MKLSVELYTVAKHYGDKKAIEIVKDAGFDAIDYSYYYDKECEEVLGENYKEYAKEIREHLDLVGIPCNQAHAPFNFKYGMTADTSEPKYLNIVRAIESASILGAKNIVVHAISVPEGVDFEEYNVEYYKSFIPYCEAFNIHVAVENLYSKDAKRNYYRSRFGSPQELNNVIKKIDSPVSLKLNYISAIILPTHNSLFKPPWGLYFSLFTIISFLFSAIMPVANPHSNRRQFLSRQT